LQSFKELNGPAVDQPNKQLEGGGEQVEVEPEVVPSDVRTKQKQQDGEYCFKLVKERDFQNYIHGILIQQRA
tara:strand:- start:126 stop:341 length:216 start_codon:yes stop_codon:yes gene_type:complete